MKRTAEMLLVSWGLCLGACGCSFSWQLGNSGTQHASTFSMTGVGHGHNQAEAAQNARKDVTEQLQAQGYSSFEINPGGSQSSSCSGENCQATIEYQVTNARKGQPSSGPCGCRRGRPSSGCSCGAH